MTDASSPRPKRGDRFVHMSMLNSDARPPYGAGSFAVQVVTATRASGSGPEDFTVYFTSAERWDAGHRNGNWYFDWHKRDHSVREWVNGNQDR